MWCNGCSQEKDAQAFYAYKNGKPRFPCIQCFVKSDAARRISNPLTSTKPRPEHEIFVGSTERHQKK